MRISTIGYQTKQGFKNIGRNKMFSIASIATMAACIFLFGIFFSIVTNFRYMVQKAEEGVAITVFFDEEATESKARYDDVAIHDFAENHDYPVRRVDLDRLQDYATEYQETLWED